MKHTIIILAIITLSSCSSTDTSTVTIMDRVYQDPTVSANYVEYCNGGYLYEIYISQDDMSFCLITDDINNMTWIAIFDFHSDITCSSGSVAPYDNQMIGQIHSYDTTIDIIGTIGLECLSTEGNWSPIDATLSIELYNTPIHGK